VEEGQWRMERLDRRNERGGRMKLILKSTVRGLF
jgi:hypothetical protein